MVWARNLHIPTAGILTQLLTVVRMRPAPLILLVMSIFYLWVYVRRAAPTVPKRSGLIGREFAIGPEKTSTMLGRRAGAAL
jgi:hypothetical protein